MVSGATHLQGITLAINHMLGTAIVGGTPMEMELEKVEGCLKVTDRHARSGNKVIRTELHYKRDKLLKL
jgi:hypothetical protein